MRKEFLLLAALALPACATSGKRTENRFVSSAEQTKFFCTGAFEENKAGQLTLTIFKNSYHADGNAHPGDGFDANIDCRGKYNGDSPDKVYEMYDVSPECTADFVKISMGMAYTGEGMLVLGRKKGGNKHDRTDNAYRMYHCQVPGYKPDTHDG